MSSTLEGAGKSQVPDPETSPPWSSRFNEDDEISLLDIAIILAKHKWKLIGIPFLAAVVAAGISLLMPNIYTARAVILPPQPQSSSTAALIGQLGALSGAAPSLGLKNPGDLFVGMLSSRTVADRLIERFDLRTLFGTDTMVATRNQLLNRTRIDSGRDGLISIAFDDKDPKRAANVVNAYVEELDRLTQTIAVTEAGLRRLFFERQLKEARDDLAQAEVALQATQEKTGVIQPTEQAKATIDAFAALRAQIAAKEVQLSAMGTFATKENPDYVRTVQELDGLRSQLNRLQRGSNSPDMLVSPNRAPEVALKYARAYRDVKYYETLFDLLARQFELAKVEEAREAAVVQVLDRAVPPDRKSKPNRMLIVLVTGLIVGFSILIWAFMRENFDRAATRDAGKLSELKSFLRLKQAG